ncbi:MAG TPA: hypothetical protein VK807_10645 [Gemmatimonadaceae bacterium]|nr:hypothetical protein [Gemmatimonadaceae bacterium]
MHVEVNTENRVRAGLITGALAASATAGAMLGIAAPQHYSPFAATGRQALATLAPAATPSVFVATLVGLALHTLIAFFWAFLFVALAARARGVRLVIAAAASSAVIWALNVWLASSVLRFGNDLTAFAAQATLFYAVLTAAFVGGIALARIAPDGT